MGQGSLCLRCGLGLDRGVRPEGLGGDVGEVFGHGIQVFGNAGTAERDGSGLSRAKAGDGKSILFRINLNLHRFRLLPWTLISPR